MKYLIRGVGGLVLVGILTANVVTLVKVSKLAKDVEQVKQEVKEVQQVVLYRSKERIQVSEKELDCLARNIFYEAGVEDRAGKVAVAQVTMNRLKTGRWGRDICSVVYAYAQFSWTLDKQKRQTTPKGELWQESIRVANDFVYKGKRVKGLESSTYYHADYVNPYWRKDVVKIQQIGQHIFYKKVDA